MVYLPAPHLTVCVEAAWTPLSLSVSANETSETQLTCETELTPHAPRKLS